MNFFKKKTPEDYKPARVRNLWVCTRCGTAWTSKAECCNPTPEHPQVRNVVEELAALRGGIRQILSAYGIQSDTTWSNQDILRAADQLLKRRRS